MKKVIAKILIIYLIIIFIPISIFADDEITDENFSIENVSIETSSNINDEPEINARHAIVFDRNSKTSIYGKKELEKCKMASTTKIMTAIVIIENCNLNDTVKISSKSAGTGGSRLGLAKNDKISVKHLLYGLMMKSGNDAAVALAEYSSGNIENFAQKMNKKAKELNLTNTNFITPHGLDNENHYTTAYDLAILTDYALNNETFFKIVNSKYYTILINNQPRNISNTNELLGNFDGIYGVKTGFTNGANRCLVTACKRNSLDYICVVLGCDTKKDRTQDSVDLLNYAFKNFSLIDIKQIALKKFEDWIFSHQNSFYINKGKSNKLDLKISIDDLPFSNIAVKNSEKDNIRAEISYSSYFEAPLYENTRIGKLSLSINPQKCYSVDILNKNEILKKSIYDYSIFIFKNYIKLLCKNSPI